MPINRQIIGNEIARCAGRGIDFQLDAGPLTTRDNAIYDCTLEGVRIDAIAAGVTSVTLANNRITGNQRGGVSFMNSAGGATFTYTILQGNRITNNGTTGTPQPG